jgi:hypothetical protein
MACAGLRADLPEWKFPSRTFRGLEQDCQKNMVKDGCELLQAQYVNLPQKVELREGSTSATPVTHPCDGRHNDFRRRSPKPETPLPADSARGGVPVRREDHAMVYLPVSMTFWAIVCRNATRLKGSYLASRRRMASCERSMSPSAQAAMTIFAALSTLSIAPAM